MDLLRQNLGVEVDSAFLKVNFQWMFQDQQLKVRGSRRFKNTYAGIESLHEWLKKKRDEKHPVHLTMEATGNYYENTAYYFESKPDFEVHVLLPNVSRAFARSLNLKSKNDAVDASMLGRLGCERKLEEWQPLSKQMRQIKLLCRERKQLSSDKTIAQNRLHAVKSGYLPNKDTVVRMNRRIAFIEKQMGRIEKEIRDLVNEDAALKERLDHVCTLRGIGLMTAVSVVAELNGFTFFENRSQVVSYCGFDVVENKSGKSKGGKTNISKKGNSYVRAALFMSALTHIKYDDHAKNYYTRIVQKSSIKMKGIVAIQRKLLLLIYTLYTRNVPYDPTYHERLKEKLQSRKRLVSPVPG